MWFIAHLQATLIGLLVYNMFYAVNVEQVTLKISRNELSLTDTELNMEPLYKYINSFVTQRLLSTTSVAGTLKSLVKQLQCPVFYVNSISKVPKHGSIVYRCYHRFSFIAIIG